MLDKLIGLLEQYLSNAGDLSAEDFRRRFLLEHLAIASLDPVHEALVMAIEGGYSDAAMGYRSDAELNSYLHGLLAGSRAGCRPRVYQEAGTQQTVADVRYGQAE